MLDYIVFRQTEKWLRTSGEDIADLINSEKELTPLIAEDKMIVIKFKKRSCCTIDKAGNCFLNELITANILKEVCELS